MAPIKSDPNILGGTPCFTGTRVPVQSLFDYLLAGRTIEYFLAQFPTVERWHVEGVLEYVGRLVAGPPPGQAA
jgi:uncharacterized protein (DUF433 family)